MADFALHIRALGQKVGSFIKATEQHVDLDLISATIHHGCMGLPQELVDHVIATLHDDLPALKACSLTCKAMFASTRHLIHQKLCLTPRNNKSILTREEENFLRLKWRYQDVQLRFLSYMGERGFLQYTREIYIHNARQVDNPDTDTFTPDTLLPHIHHFQSLDRVHAITIEHFDSDVWASRYKSYFAHFYPTLTSLTLRRPLGHQRRVFQFALQFPNLENLSLEWVDKNVGRDLTAPTIGDQPSHPRRHLRLARTGGANWWPMNSFHELRNGFNFRSLELEDSFGDHDQDLLNMCTETIQYLALTASTSKEYEQLRFLKLTELKDLRRLTVCPVVLTFPNIAFEFLPILTITSPTFCELVLVVGGFCSYSNEMSWGRWAKVDGFLHERFAKHGDFRLIIRTGNRYSLGAFQRHAKEGFPLLASGGCIHFDTSPLIDKYWD